VVSIVPRERDLAVVNLLRFHDVPSALVFCGTRDGVTHLAANLNERGFSVVALSGELSQRERNQALQALRDGRARVCVATDVAARGLDLPDLGLVIHADLPQNKEVLVHRSGRTGRAGKKGLAVIVAVDAARRFVERLLHSARIPATWQLPPSSDAIRERDQAHLALEIQALTEGISDADRAVARALLANSTADDLVAALVRLRREARPEPEELTMPPSMRPRPPADHPRSPSGHSNHRGHLEHRSPRAVRAPTRPRDMRNLVWFTINIGRSKNADPKWLIPLLCRRGGISKNEIGAFQILARETRVEISLDVSERFAAAVRELDTKDRNIHIEPLEAVAN
jgi:ATP-dependent RNA helicase DeaD